MHIIFIDILNMYGAVVSTKNYIISCIMCTPETRTEMPSGQIWWRKKWDVYAWLHYAGKQIKLT